MSRWVSLAVLLAIIAITGAVMYKVMASFLLPLFLASVLTVMFRPLHGMILERCGNRPALAAAATTLLILLTVLAPLTGVFTFAVREAFGAVGGDVIERAEQRISRSRSNLGLDIPFRTLPAEDGESRILLTDLDRLVDELPGQLPETNEFTFDHVEQLTLLDEGLRRLSVRMQYLANQLPTDDDSGGGSPEVQCVRRMRAARGEHAFDELTEMRETLELTLNYARAGEAALRPLPMVDDADISTDASDERDADVASGTAEPNSLASDATPAAKDEDPRPTKIELRRRYGRLPARYTAFRIDMTGGPVWSWLTELANPGSEQFDALRLNVQRYLRGWLPSVAGQATQLVGRTLLGLAILTLSVFYFLKDGPGMVQTLMKLSPLDDRYERELLIEFDKVSRAVVLATLLSAVGQALLASVGYFCCGFHSVFLLTSLTFVLSMVPFVGAAAVWFPACLWLAFVEERVFAAVGFFIYGALIVSMADNVIKPFVLHGQSRLHPLLALLSVLGGVQALGPIGILVGPMVVSFLQALLNILRDELNHFDGKSAKSAA